RETHQQPKDGVFHTPYVSFEAFGLRRRIAEPSLARANAVSPPTSRTAVLRLPRSLGHGYGLLVPRSQRAPDRRASRERYGVPRTSGLAPGCGWPCPKRLAAKAPPRKSHAPHRRRSTAPTPPKTAGSRRRRSSLPAGF